MSSTLYTYKRNRYVYRNESTEVEMSRSSFHAHNISEKISDNAKIKDWSSQRAYLSLIWFVFSLSNKNIFFGIFARNTKLHTLLSNGARSHLSYGTLFLFVILLVNLPLAASGQQEPAPDPFSIPA
ncbi:MAG: hypothetical protein M3382_05785, partial [Thermoproteota archaeon]|nr:hypothetical protein [Thermoproteota archaeon]